MADNDAIDAPPTVTEPVVTETPTPVAVEPQADKELVELVEDLRNLGLDRSKLQQLWQKGITLDNISYNLANNPRAVAEMIKNVAPQSYEKLRGMITKDYVDDYADPDNTSSGEGNRSGQTQRGANTGQSALERRLLALEQAQQQQAQYNQRVNVRSEYDKRLDQAIENVSKQRESAGAPLTPRDKKSLRALVNASYGEDTVASQRAQQGVFIDLSKHLKKVLDDWDLDVTTATGNEAARRDAVAAGASKVTVTTAAQTTSSTVSPKSLEEDWDLGGEDFAKALRAGKK